MSSTQRNDQFGPWKLLIEDNNESKEIIAKPNKTEEKKVLSLPKMNKQQVSPLNIPKKTRYQLDVPLKVRPLKIELEKEFVHGEIEEARHSKTLTFDPPLISFYNKNHRKTNKLKMPAILKAEEPQSLKNRVSKIDLLCEQNGLNNKSTHESYALSSQYEFSKKRSIKEVLKYMKNPNLIPNPHLHPNLLPTPSPRLNNSINKKYKEMSNILSIDKIDKYVPTRMKVSMYGRKR